MYVQLSQGSSGLVISNNKTFWTAAATHISLSRCSKSPLHIDVWLAQLLCSCRQCGSSGIVESLVIRGTRGKLAAMNTVLDC